MQGDRSARQGAESRDLAIDGESMVDSHAAGHGTRESHPCPRRRCHPQVWKLMDVAGVRGISFERQGNSSEGAE